jgi:nucleotide-binding universal stress UspA family protein
MPDFDLTVRQGKRSPGVLKTLRSKHQRQMISAIERTLEETRRTLQAEGIEPGMLTRTGSPADVLIGMADDYDVVVLGAHSRTERPSPGLGPVASRILERTSGVVLIGRELSNERNFRILAAVDGSASAENALDTLMSHFRIDNAEITLIHVIEKPWLRLGLEETPSTDLADASENEQLFAGELREEAAEILENARARLAGRPGSIETLVVDGNPATELLRQAEIGEYDLAIVGATGVSDLKHTLLGSVSFKLASYAPCSVAVVR